MNAETNDQRTRWLDQLENAGLSPARAREVVALVEPSIRLRHPDRSSLTRRPNRSLPRGVRGLYSVAALAAGFNFTLALLDNGTVMGWGRNDAGQLGDGTVVDRIEPVFIDGLTDVVAVAAGFAHGLALLADGTVASWGANYKGQLGDGSTEDRVRPGPVASIDQPVTAIAAGWGHNLALLGDGSVVGWGDNSSSELGPGGEFRLWTSPRPVGGLERQAVAVAAGSSVSAALFADGSVQAWGGTLFGDKGGVVGEVTPHRVSGIPAPVVSVVASASILALLQDGSIWSYRCPHYQSEGLRTPNRVDLPGPAVAISSWSLTTLALLVDGTVMAWGLNDKGQLGSGEASGPGLEQPTPVQGLAHPVRHVCAGDEHCAVIFEDGSVADWGGDYPVTLSDIEGADPDIPLGASKLGGRPDLPRESPWPATKGPPQAFVCQLNLAEISPLDPQGLLPAEGLLLFFYDLATNVAGFDPADRGGWHVAYTPPGVPLVRFPFPPQLPSSQRFPGLPVSGVGEVTLPPSGSPALQPLGLAEDEERAYHDAVFDYVHETPQCHRMLGYAQPIQNDMQLECQLVTNGLYLGNASGWSDSRRHELEEGAQDWVLLLQVDSDEEANMTWGDCGRLYYWIHRDDLRGHRFDQSWFVFQGH